MKTFKPLVTIVIPVYNGSNYVKEAIDSALAQTYKNIEIIVINDGSTDNTEEILKLYGKKIRYFLKENGGVATALNLGIEKSKGRYISWLSHDDIYYEDKIEKQIKAISKEASVLSDKIIIFSNYSLIDKNGNKIGMSEFEKTHDINKLIFPIYPILTGLVHGCTLLVPKKCFDEVGLFDPKLKTTQDYDLWFKMFPKYKLLFMSNYFVKSRCHDEQGSKTIKVVNKEADNLWIKMINNTSEKDKYYIAGSVLNFYRTIYKVIENTNYSGAKSFIRLKINENIKSIKVSIIIPFYNRINWVLESIESALKQTHKNIEIILIDDCSTDSTRKIENIVKKDRRLIFIKNSINSGPAKSRNSAINIANGDYICFLDSDDIFDSKKIENQLLYMVSGNYDITHTSYYLFGANNPKKIIHSGDNDYKFPRTIHHCMIATPTVMIKKTIIDNEPLFPENFLIGEDICFWIYLSKKYLIKGIDIPLTWVRLHGNNASFDIKKSIIGLSNIYTYVLNNFFENSSLKELLKVQKTIEELIITYNNENNTEINESFKENINVPVLLKISQKEKLKSFLKKILCKINPLYRKIAVCKDKIDVLTNNFNNLSTRNEELFNTVLDNSKNLTNSINNLSTRNEELFNTVLDNSKNLTNNINNLSIKNEELFNNVANNWKENVALKNNLNELEKIVYPEKESSFTNLNGDKIKFSEHKKSKLLEFNLTTEKFLIQMKEYIIRSNVLIDIGCGIRPQIFFEPSVHICIEPYKKYREIIKPYFPNRSNVVYIKSDALDGLKRFDDNSVDSIFMFDLIEHLEKGEGLKLIKEADRVARKQVVIFTPLGFYPMYYKKGEKDAWGLNGTDLQEHKSGWTPKDFDKNWDFYICNNCHQAFLPEEKAIGKMYSAMMAIKTKKFDGYLEVEGTPDFVKNLYKERIEK